MVSVPCVERDCELKNKDKNNKECENCGDRMRHVLNIGHEFRTLPVETMDAWRPRQKADKIPIPKKVSGCMLPGCGLPVFSRGLCQNHYTKLLRGTILKINTVDLLDPCDVAVVLRSVIRISERFKITMDETIVVLIDEGLKQYAARTGL